LSDKKNNNSKKTEEEQEKPQPPTENHEEDASAGNELSQLRADVDHLANDLQSTVTELKKSIVDIRSAVSEIENPFNLLRTISSEKDVKKLNGERMPPGVKSLILGNTQESIASNEEAEEEPKAQAIKPQPVRKPEPQPPQAPQTEPKTETQRQAPQTDAQPNVQLQPPKTNTAYVDWIWNLLDSGLKANDIHQLACSCEFMGYLPAQANEFIYSLAVAAEKLREKGFTKGHLLLNLYKAAAISKVDMGWEDMEALIAITQDQLKRSKPAKGAE
jgi:hypothetical protein